MNRRRNKLKVRREESFIIFIPDFTLDETPIPEWEEPENTLDQFKKIINESGTDTKK